ncbi:hypothetical protein EVAR_98648_1 [Eumeta japonica]|uniref:Uncharacterized protein n=1 Tax=Eumeta variegata TaxID=151549 RepID=A0A4C1XY38_EUMVA|nr:hypothetical protein EVAR_98648_1 [Eumeta japonica]
MSLINSWVTSFWLPLPAQQGRRIRPPLLTYRGARGGHVLGGGHAAVAAAAIGRPRARRRYRGATPARGAVRGVPTRAADTKIASSPVSITVIIDTSWLRSSAGVGMFLRRAGVTRSGCRSGVTKVDETGRAALGGTAFGWRGSLGARGHQDSWPCGPSAFDAARRMEAMTGRMPVGLAVMALRVRRVWGCSALTPEREHTLLILKKAALVALSLASAVPETKTDRGFARTVQNAAYRLNRKVLG